MDESGSIEAPASAAPVPAKPAAAAVSVAPEIPANGEAPPSPGGNSSSQDKNLQPLSAEGASSPEKIRQDSWDKGLIPDDILEAAKPPNNRDGRKIYSAHLRRPRKGEGGAVYAELDLERLKENQALYHDAVEHGMIHPTSSNDGVVDEGVDMFVEWGGEENFREFSHHELDYPDDPDHRYDNPNGIMRLSESLGIVPKEGQTADSIADRFDEWWAEETANRVRVLQKKQKQPSRGDGPPGPTANGGPDVSPDKPVDQASAKKGKKVVNIGDVVREAEAVAADAAKRVNENRDRAQREKKEKKEKEEKSTSTVITEEEAGYLTDLIARYKKEEQELLASLKTATDADKPKIEGLLKDKRLQKAQAMLTSLGYTQKTIDAMLSGTENVTLPLFLRLAKHSELTKDKGPNLAELNVLLKRELIEGIAELINNGKSDNEKKSWEQVRLMKAGEALRAAMQALGFDKEMQEQNIKKLFESANGDDRKLNTSENDPLTVLLEAFLTGEPVLEGAKNMDDWLKKLHEEYTKLKSAGEQVDDFEKWLEKKIKDNFHPEIAEAVALYVSRLVDEHLNVGEFMEMLLIGDYYSSLAHDLGFKSKEQLIHEGKKPIGEAEVDRYIRKNESRADNARQLLCAGLRDIHVVNDENLEQFRRNPSPLSVLKDETFLQLLKTAFSKEHYKKFVTRLLEELGYTEKEQESRHIELSHDAIVYIMGLPKLAVNAKWVDGGGEEGGESGKKAGASPKEDSRDDVAPLVAEQKPKLAEENPK